MPPACHAQEHSLRRALVPFQARAFEPSVPFICWFAARCSKTLRRCPAATAQNHCPALNCPRWNRSGQKPPTKTRVKAQGRSLSTRCPLVLQGN